MRFVLLSKLSTTATPSSDNSDSIGLKLYKALIGRTKLCISRRVASDLVLWITKFIEISKAKRDQVAGIGHEMLNDLNIAINTMNYPVLAQYFAGMIDEKGQKEIGDV